MFKTKYIEGYGDKYTISSDGTITSMYRISNIHGVLTKVGEKKKLKPSKDKKGYLIVNLYNGNGKPKSFKVHRLVAIAFLPNPENKRCVCHKDNNPTNCNVENLYWGTDKENQKQAWEDGIHKNRMSVIKYDKQNNIVCTYESQSEASRQSGIPQSNIWKCIKGERKTAGGYIWRKSD